ncbi:MAG TPA: glycosyltransferase family 2 protein [Candidatus Limnocylindria bacterium]|nr:glycosyltransferase family 2 protein [Candidatus Limnocylindria bacterium]
MTDSGARPASNSAQVLDVTVVVPVHNSAGTLGRALASIRAQTRQPAAVIVVDDASSDNSAELARDLGLANLRVIRHAVNRGPGAARNTGTTEATTEWVAFLDSDDEWEPTFLEEVSDVLESTCTDFAASGGVRHFAGGRSERLIGDEPALGSDRTDELWRLWLRFNRSPINSSSAILRRSLLQRVGGYPEDLRRGEDLVTYARLWLEGRFAFLNRPLWHVHQTQGSLTTLGPSFYEARQQLARLGRSLLTAAIRRRPGATSFLLVYLQLVARRLVWVPGWIRSRGEPVGRRRVRG